MIASRTLRSLLFVGVCTSVLVTLNAACKRHETSRLTGKTLEELKDKQIAKSIDYDTLFRDRDGFRYTAVIAYESTYTGNTSVVVGGSPLGGVGNAQLDRGVYAAYAFQELARWRRRCRPLPGRHPAGRRLSGVG